MFPFVFGERYWPVSAAVALINAPVSKVLRAYPTKPTTVVTLPDIHTALEHGPHIFGSVQHQQLLHIGTRDGRTAVLSTNPTESNLPGIFEPLARIRLRTDAAVAVFLPGTTQVWPVAHFISTQHPPKGKYDFLRDRRALGATMREHGWEWTASGEPRPWENSGLYDARRVRDRLPLEVIGTHLHQAGIPIDDPEYIFGPVHITHTVYTDIGRRTWTGIRDLRMQLGYDPENPVIDQLGTAHP